MRAETLARPSFTRQISIGSSINFKGGSTMPKTLRRSSILSLPTHTVSAPFSPDRIFTGEIGKMTIIWQRPKPAEPSVKKAYAEQTTAIRTKNPLAIHRKIKPPIHSMFFDKKTAALNTNSNQAQETKPKNKVEKISVEMLKAFLAKQGQKPSIEAHSQNGQTKKAASFALPRHSGLPAPRSLGEVGSRISSWLDSGAAALPRMTAAKVLTALEAQTGETKLAKPLSATAALLKYVEPKARHAIRIMLVRQALAKEVAQTKPVEQTRASAEQAVKTQTVTAETQTLLQKKIEKVMGVKNSNEEPGKTQKTENREQETAFEVDQPAREERKRIIQAAVSETEHKANTQNYDQVKELSGASLAFEIMQRKTIKAMSQVATNNDGSFIKLAISAIGKKFYSAKEAKAEEIAVLEKTPPAKIALTKPAKSLSREYVFRVILQGFSLNPFKLRSES